MDLRESLFETGDVALNYAQGPPNGPAFVLLHAGAARWQYGRGLLEALADDWHVYAPDFRGHGKSGRVPAAYSLGDYVRDTAAFLAGAVKEPAIVFGHSLGGEVAVMLAARYPELVKGLIVGDAPLSTRQHATEQPWHRAQNELWHGLAGRPLHQIEAALRDSPILVPGEALPRPAREIMGESSPWFAFQAMNLHQLDPDVLAAVLAGPDAMLVGYEPEALLPAIRCPVLLLQADPHGPLHGGVLRDDEVELGLKLLPRAAHLRLDGVGHPLHGPPEQTRRVVEAITPFLRNTGLEPGPQPYL
jgi:pimeloyl-ACP methyl ester carboxylesterase